MARRPAPTKANLFRIQKDLAFAREGRDLLHQKREVLVMELMGVVASFGEVESGLRQSLAAAQDAFLPALLAVGREGIERLYGARGGEFDLDIRERAVMGIPLPRVSVAAGGEIADPGLLDSPASLDRAAAELRGTLDRLTRYVEIAATIWRLATEIEKTQKRINALENIFIPQSKTVIAWIKSEMEENDREEFFRRKLLKARSG